ncbi:MAG: hypothetical protein ACI9EQ_002052 [Bacteroidia bacterium]|jgi:hypothetical protein
MFEPPCLRSALGTIEVPAPPCKGEVSRNETEGSFTKHYIKWNQY